MKVQKPTIWCLLFHGKHINTMHMDGVQYHYCNKCKMGWIRYARKRS